MNAQVQAKQILFPPMRLVQGSLYKAQDKDANGAPRVFPPGHPKAGQPKVSFFFAGAVPKNPGEAAWWDTAWGREVLAIGQQAWPQGQWQTPSFAWKIEDGDSQIPNKRGRKNASTEGMPGNWIINFSSGFAPKICDERGQPLLQPDLVKLGYWVEVLGTVRSNETATNPGVYINHDHVAFRGIAKEIYQGVDPSTVGFGKAALPPGVGVPQPGATMPSAVGVPGAAAVPSTPGAMPPAPGAYPTPPGGSAYGSPPVPNIPGAAAPGVPAAVPPAAAPTPVVAHPGFLQPPAAPGAMSAVPTMPSVPAAAPVVVCPLGAPMGYKMANLNGPRFEAFKAQGWNEAQMVQAGHMVKL